MSVFTKVLLASVLALFSVTSLQAGSKTNDTSSKKSAYANWKFFELDSAIAEESAKIKFPVKPRSGTDGWTGLPFFIANAQHIKFSVSVAPFDEFVSDLVDDEDDFDHDSYSSLNELKQYLMELYINEIKDDCEDLDEYKLYSLETNQHAGFPAVTYAFEDIDEHKSIKRRLIITDHAAYLLTVESKISIDVANDPVSDFFIDSIRFINR